MVVAWLLLLAAISTEVTATALLPRTHGFRAPLWTLLVLGGYALSIWLLAVVIRHIPVSVSYAIWAGLGTAGIAIVSTLWLGERMDLVKAAALAMIIAGVVILNLRAGH
jgi:small multidrug resistance pump